MLRRQSGFTLMELMVVLAIIGILLAVAIPGFADQMRKSRRAEAMRGLADFQLKQERWRSSHATYLGTNSAAADKTTLGVPVSDHYTFDFDSTESATAFTVKADAKSSSPQAGDTGCTTMKIIVNAGVVTKDPDPATTKCWR